MIARRRHVLTLFASLAAASVPTMGAAGPQRLLASWSEHAGPQVVWRYQVWTDGRTLYSEGRRNDKPLYRESLPLARITCITNESAIRIYSQTRDGVSIVDLRTGTISRSDVMSLVAREASTTKRLLRALLAISPIVRAKRRACIGAGDLALL